MLKRYSAAVLTALFFLSVVPAIAQQQDAATAQRLACMRTAVEKREDAIGAAWDKLSNAVKAAFGTRKSELLIAWGMTNRQARNVAIRQAWDKFRKSRKDARREHDVVVKAAWTQFVTERKACKELPTGEDLRLDSSTADAEVSPLTQ